ncbi:thioredoxin domain-containing protein [Zunongwangia endophytica]|uniref:Thioredoxin domain-containing protein n=1 Tax=Zunongwangia endophytica TaxID=1808945 RepID=A0ABV8H8K1_9FLAO|nr:thioredoxin domain-containing protein [Zunongwangia endophytica]MDN3596296.1 thioredoxin domain-containing protein [Zunongwangia endophytica]
MESPQFTNDLINETSPYLLQHAHNPVDWRAWNKTALEEAKQSNKLIIISVGYSACHWCHVMEHESFEDHEVADIMNAHYISIKVDREERPDIDQVYMQAVQIMTGSGGWPMNIVALPDGRPVWGGTYFRKEQWISALRQIRQIYEKEPEQLTNYAEKLEKGLHRLNTLEIGENALEFSQERLKNFIEIWKPHLDVKLGGSRNAPKFMMPTNLDFLLRYSYQFKDEELENYVLHTLDKISFGGTFDHVDGGFSRYSVDARWHLPHFEKMLYDNAQLLSVYSKAYKLTSNPWYKEIIEKTANFIQNELTDTTGAFYSALDADSKNENGKQEEGAYYTWKAAELQELLISDYDLFASYFNINEKGYWENGNYILYKTEADKNFAEKHRISLEELQSKKQKWTDILSEARKKREKPGLDDKTLTSWNALTITGFVDAYAATGNLLFLEIATKNANFIIENQCNPDFRLYHSYKNGKSKINGYLEDYAFSIEAFIKLYEATFDEKWIDYAENWLQYSISNLYNDENGLFNFTSLDDDPLISTPIEFTDNVIPASNSAMANNLFRLSKLLGNLQYQDIAIKMLKIISEKIDSYPMGYSNWLHLYMSMSNPFYELAILGDKSMEYKTEIQKNYNPNLIISGSKTESALPLLSNRLVKEKTLLYLCEEGKCQLPDEDLRSILNKIALV